MTTTALHADPRVIRLYTALRDLSLSLLNSSGCLMACWEFGARRGIASDANAIRDAVVHLAHLDPARRDSQHAPAIPAALPRDLASDVNGLPPACTELRRLVEYHQHLATLSPTYTCAERALHRKVAVLLASCDPRTWPDEWHRQPASAIRARIIMHITAAIDLAADTDTSAHLDVARTIIATTGVAPRDVVVA